MTFKHRRYSLNSFAAIARKVSKKLINNYIDWIFIFIFFFCYFLLILLHFAPLQVVCCQRQKQRVSSCASRFGCDFCAYYPIVQMSARTRSEQRDIYIYFLTRMRPNLGWLGAFSHQFENKQTVCHFRAEQSLRKNRMKYRTCVYTLYIYEYI